MKPNEVFDILNQCDNSDLENLRSKTFAGACGFITFPATISLFQCVVWKPLKIAAHSRLAGCCGLITVFASSFISNLSVELAYSLQMSSWCSLINITNVAACAFLSVTQFFVIAGTFKVVLPSHLLHVGAFARAGLKPKSFFASANNNQRRIIQTLGYQHGCHTCGKRYSKLINCIKKSAVLKYFVKYKKGKYVADHQPPKVVAVFSKQRNNSMGKLFPQCVGCSQLQASCARFAAENNAKAFVTHGLRFKLWKLFFPWPMFFDSEMCISVIQQLFKI